MRLTNAEADWDRWPVGDYLAENYRQLHPSDDAVLVHHSAFYRGFAPGGLARSLEFGVGPNLYPLMLAAAASRRIDAVDRSLACLAYLAEQLRTGPDPSWLPFYARCRQLNPALPADPAAALSRVRPIHADARAVRPGAYDAASMNFVAESVTEDAVEFAGFCGAFIRSVRPGGHLVAAFMENMASYELGDGSRWPAYAVGSATVRETFAPHVERLTVTRIDADPSLPDYGYTGMVLLTARRARDAR
jgi:hypothetical protein